MTLQGVMSSVVSVWRWRRSRTPAIVEAPTHKRFLLFLRSTDSPSGPLDAAVARSVGSVAQVVGIGGPPGTSGIVTAKDFRRLTEQAAAILIAPGRRAGIQWELASLEQRGLLSKCLFLAPNATATQTDLRPCTLATDSALSSPQRTRHKLIAASWAVAFCLLAGSASAQNPPIVVNQDNKLEHMLDLIEDNAFIRLLKVREGFGLRLGGIDGGPSFAFGPVWRTSRALHGHATLQASAAFAPTGDRDIAAGLIIPEAGSHRFGVAFTMSNSHLARERLYSEGIDSSRADETFFALDRQISTIEATLIATRQLRIRGGVRLASMKATHDEPTTFGVTFLSAELDRRDVPGNPRRGGWYAVGLERYADRSHARRSFNQVSVDIEQHFSWWRRERLLTLRATAVHSDVQPGQDVPFYFQPTLGGSRWLRGYVTDRFRDRHLLALQAEYGWDIWPFLNAVVFYEIGQVARTWTEMTLNRFRSDYGFGFRLGSTRTVAVRTDVAFGSGEGTRFSMRLSHAF